MAQVALAWVLSKDGEWVVWLLAVAHLKISVVAAPIVGTSSVEKLNDTIRMSCSVLYPQFFVDYTRVRTTQVNRWGNTVPGGAIHSESHYWSYLRVRDVYLDTYGMMVNIKSLFHSLCALYIFFVNVIVVGLILTRGNTHLWFVECASNCCGHLSSGMGMPSQVSTYYSPSDA